MKGLRYSMNYDKNIKFSFSTRRAFFDAYIKQIDAQLETCPCGGYPTLQSRGNYNMCYLCFWEDDGQDDFYAEVIRGGPNSDLSLSTARYNFDKYFFIYDDVDQSMIIKLFKSEVINLFNFTIKEPSEIKRSKYWTQATEKYENLRILIIKTTIDFK